MLLLLFWGYLGWLKAFGNVNSSMTTKNVERMQHTSNIPLHHFGAKSVAKTIGNFTDLDLESRMRVGRDQEVMLFEGAGNRRVT